MSYTIKYIDVDHTNVLQRRLLIISPLLLLLLLIVLSCRLVDVSHASVATSHVAQLQQQSPTSDSQVVEHAVLFDMPTLEGDEELEILEGLYNLQFIYENVLQLFVGRVFNDNPYVTHALIMRFPTYDILVDYYNSTTLRTIASKMGPYLEAEYTSDYFAWTTNAYNETNLVKQVYMNFMAIKDTITRESMSIVIEALSSLGNQVDYVQEITMGESFHIRYKGYNYGSTAYLLSSDALEMLNNNKNYTTVINDDIVPYCSQLISIYFEPFSPTLSAV